MSPTRGGLIAGVLCVYLIGSLPVEGVEKKQDLSGAEARAQIAEMSDKGLALVDMSVKVVGGEPRYDLIFDQGMLEFRYVLECNRAQLADEMRMAAMRGGVRHVAVIGFNRGKDPSFCVLSHFVGPPGAPPFNQKVLLDVFPRDLDGVVAQEHRLGGRLARTSTYKAPDGRELHTLIFEAR